MPASGRPEPGEERRREYARGMAWFSRSTAVVGEMVLPGILGAYLDSRWGTSWMAPVGMIFGVVGGISHLVWMSQHEGKPSPRKRPPPSSDVGHE